jgi:hypothetical protein
VYWEGCTGKGVMERVYWEGCAGKGVLWKGARINNVSHPLNTTHTPSCIHSCIHSYIHSCIHSYIYSYMRGADLLWTLINHCYTVCTLINHCYTVCTLIDPCYIHGADLLWTLTARKRGRR